MPSVAPWTWGGMHGIGVGCDLSSRYSHLAPRIGLEHRHRCQESLYFFRYDLEEVRHSGTWAYRGMRRTFLTDFSLPSSGMEYSI